MAIQQVDGSAATSTSTNNNGGSVVNGGSSTVLDSINLGNTNGGPIGTLPIDGTDTDKALSAGTFAYNNPGPIAPRVTTTLSGVSNTVLRSGAAVPGQIRSIHKLEVLRTRRLTTAIRAGKWNIFKGAFLNNQNQSADLPTVAVDSLSSDNAATPTRAVPGELTYKTGAPIPVNDDYKAKTG